jgi:hypothetical protein
MNRLSNTRSYNRLPHRPSDVRRPAVIEEILEDATPKVQHFDPNFALTLLVALVLGSLVAVVMGPVLATRMAPTKQEADADLANRLGEMEKRLDLQQRLQTQVLETQVRQKAQEEKLNEVKLLAEQKQAELQARSQHLAHEQSKLTAEKGELQARSAALDAHKSDLECRLSNLQQTMNRLEAQMMEQTRQPKTESSPPAAKKESRPSFIVITGKGNR